MKENIKIFKNRPVAYFCAEYALFDHTPLYTGGLGILAGDYINEIVKQNFPAVAIGLFYHKEHLHGLELSRERKTPSELGLELLKDKDGSILKIPIFLGDHSANVQIWKWSKGQLTLFLLDTQVEENSPYDWTITDTLYVEDRDLRLKQEIILGIGGMKVKAVAEEKMKIVREKIGVKLY
jgi:glucan phosphorylase